MEKKVSFIAIALALSLPVKAGVMEELVVDPNTGFVIAVLDEEQVNPNVSASKSNTASMNKPTKTLANKQVASGSTAGKTKALTTPRLNTKSVKSELTQGAQSPAVNTAQVSHPVRQPTVTKKPAQNALLGSIFSYVRVVRPNDRVHINEHDGLVYFHLRKGSLKENIVSLLEPTTAYPPVMGGISDNHQVSADMWLSGESVYDILDTILLSYNEPYPIYANPRGNRIIEIMYDRKRIFGGQ
ncbi:hypothetical protein NB545_19575 [Vibrio campbellii]|uniref:hypothetical protein n=1 Tax=Vibrio campbellii TaxID=680 RepID=UPI00215D00FE|nr:hypothetical protein [Vibrio campbellii]MCR9909637.1 hypothetical protein [Vibrio campbellii]